MFSMADRWRLAGILALLASPLLYATEAVEDVALEHSLAELRSAVGTWSVATEFLFEDGSVAKRADGTYEFSWVVPGRVLVGRSDIPELEQSAGILFYVREATRQIEMVSVAKDGRLWTMTAPLGSDVRYSQSYDTADGGKGQLRFSRFNATSESFESRMDYTEDGGETWKPGNHQVFRRQAQPAPR